ncbi:MAG: pyridoxamine 5'-phosphate oxidase family protein [Kastovskya adunca ATA6-11-RM4]|jgi:uncharacterized protein YhbP (UPF0306 family)|nr:pyridoxamine 5'-phosphate oxidase family protein [Kastovskya adunca ATA6-11-RM4]
MEPAAAENGWVNTIDSNNPEVIENARQIIENTLYCTLSTCSSEGFPWVSPVFFVPDHNWNLYWSSAVAAKHSQNIDHNNGRVAIAIFNSHVKEGTGKGLYFYGTASEVKPEQVASIMKLLFNRAGKQLHRTVEDYLLDSPRRIYQFRPTEAWISGDRLPIENQLVDIKIQLHLKDLIGAQ